MNCTYLYVLDIFIRKYEDFLLLNIYFPFYVKNILKNFF